LQYYAIFLLKFNIPLDLLHEFPYETIYIHGRGVVTLGTLVAASAANWRRCLSLVQQAQDTVAVRKRCGLGDGIISDWWFGTWLLFSIMGCHPSH
jgi:hypothetical protein